MGIDADRAPVAAGCLRARRKAELILAKLLSSFTPYFDAVIQFRPLGHDEGRLLERTRCGRKLATGDPAVVAQECGDSERAVAVLVNGNFNHSLDIQGLLDELKPALNRRSRVIVVLYNPYLRGLHRLANLLGLRKGPPPSTFVTRRDVEALASLSGFELVRFRLCNFLPGRLTGVGQRLDSLLAALPLVRWLALSCVATLRPMVAEKERRGLSIVIPARNERGNIEAALRRMPELGCPLEIIFVEGHSADGTWEEIERVRDVYGGRFRVLSARQPGRGKADAVRLGFSMATQPLLTILDADLTMPPEMLTRFYRAYCEGLGDFVNGSRLVYPMEGQAMRFLNLLGNIFFAKALSYVLSVPLGDSLCGTKLLHRKDYERMVAWRRDFGTFDPFGDFELLFPAALMDLGVVNLPIRYLDRTYGSTNINRFRHGFQLLRMVMVGLFRIKLK
jgi:hypothetical protein